MSGFHAALGVLSKPALMTFSGLYSGLGASPFEISRTVTVPAGNTGQLRFDSVSASGTFEYKIGAGSYATVTGGTIITCSNGATLYFKVTGGSATDGNVTLYDLSNGDNATTVGMSIL